MSKGFCLSWDGGEGFGEPLVASLMTNILNDNGVKAVFKVRKSVKNLVDCSLYNPDNEEHRTYQRFSWKYILSKEPIILQQIKQFEILTRKKLEITRGHIPVKFHDMPEIPSVDIAMCTESSTWTPYRNWPYFEKLKQLFDKEKISYVDLNAEKIYSIKCLNYIKKCKLYLGLETGMSHYVSRFANGKTLILQGGFSEFKFWAYLYNYSYLQINDIPCRPCFINRRDIKKSRDCKYNHRCMKEINAKQVFDKIIWLLKEKSG